MYICRYKHKAPFYIFYISQPILSDGEVKAVHGCIRRRIYEQALKRFYGNRTGNILWAFPIYQVESSINIYVYVVYMIRICLYTYAKAYQPNHILCINILQRRVNVYYIYKYVQIYIYAEISYSLYIPLCFTYMFLELPCALDESFIYVGTYMYYI